MNFFGNNKPEKENIIEIKAQYYDMFLNAHNSQPDTLINIKPQIYDSDANKLWPKVDKKIGIRINHETGKMVRVPDHGLNSFIRSTQNNVLDKLIKGYNSADNKETFIKSLENNDALTNARKKQEDKDNEWRNLMLGHDNADNARKQYVDSLRKQEILRGGKKSRKLRKNKKRKTRRKNKKRKTRRKK